MLSTRLKVNWSAKNWRALSPTPTPNTATPVPTALCPYKLRECPNCRGKMGFPIVEKAQLFFRGYSKKNWPFRAGNFFVFPCEIKTLSKFGPPASLLCNTLSFGFLKESRNDKKISCFFEVAWFSFWQPLACARGISHNMAIKINMARKKDEKSFILSWMALSSHAHFCIQSSLIC